MNAQRQARVSELLQALDSGLNIIQAGSVWPSCSPFVETVTNEYLARHIELREWGFGFTATTATDLQTYHKGFVRVGREWQVEPQRIEAEVETAVEPSPFYGLRGDA